MGGTSWLVLPKESAEAKELRETHTSGTPPTGPALALIGTMVDTLQWGQRVGFVGDRCRGLSGQEARFLSDTALLGRRGFAKALPPMGYGRP